MKFDRTGPCCFCGNYFVGFGLHTFADDFIFSRSITLKQHLCLSFKFQAFTLSLKAIFYLQNGKFVDVQVSFEE